MPALDAIFVQLRESNGGSFETARPMPGAVYHDEAFAQLERDRIFRREWICLGRAADLAQAGDFLVVAAVDRDDEIGSLTRDFNAMLAKITDLRVDVIDSTRAPDV